MSIVVAAINDGERVGRWPLAHGRDPVDLLAEHGWACRPAGSDLVGDDVEVRYEVVATEAVVPQRARPAAPRTRTLQRLAAYALVVDDGHLLLTQLAQSVSGAEGRWTLPGGGVEPGESPLEGVVREVLEEAGQHVVPGALVQVQSRHWVGDIEAGEANEDFHAVRLIHAATCPQPTPARVLEVDGSTAAAAWVPLGEVGSLPIVDMVRLAWPHVPGHESYRV